MSTLVYFKAWFTWEFVVDEALNLFDQGLSARVEEKNIMFIIVIR